MEINIFQLKLFFPVKYKKEENRTKIKHTAGMFGLKKFYSVYFLWWSHKTTR